jgi:hypothetical protein
MKTKTVPLKINGFHTGYSCACNGLREFMQELDTAGIPFFMKGADDFAGLFDAQEIAKNSSIEHVIVYRTSTAGQNDGFDYDVPAYHLSPYDAARIHWEKTRDKIPKELNPELTWIEPINEVDKNRSDWLGEFAVEIANMANTDGFKVTMFGFSSGEPEPEHWETFGMLSYLRYCEANPGMAAVSLHEYNFGHDEFEELYPWHVGRFQRLLEVCDKHGIAHPDIHFTEWGYSFQDVPAFDDAIDYVLKSGEIYAKYDCVKGVAQWTLSGGWGNIGTKLNKWIEPLTELIKTITYEVPLEESSPPKEEEEEMEERIAELEDQISDVLDRIKKLEVLSHGHTSLPPEPPEEPEIVIADIVEDLPQHSTRKYVTRKRTDITHIAIHHTVSPPDRTIYSIASYHVHKKGWPGIGYHYVIKDTGEIFMTNYLETKSYHMGTLNAPGDENLFGVGISLQGDFTHNHPPQAQKDAARKLVAYLRDKLPNDLFVGGHREMPGAATQCPGNTFGEWIGYVAGENPIPNPAPQPPPPPEKVDLLPYMRGDGRLFELQTYDANGNPLSQERNQAQSFTGGWYIKKGENEGKYEKWVVDEKYIYLDTDTSPSDAADGTQRFYKVRRSMGSTERVPWINRHASVGMTYVGGQHYVQFYDKATCQPHTQNSGWASNQTEFVAISTSLTFKKTGITVDDVVILIGNGETHFFAKGFGRVGWESAWGSAFISEIHAPGQRPDIVMEQIPC